MVIYKITNLVNNKIYIGQTINYDERVRHHKQIAFRENSKERDKPLYRAIRKYGVDNFKFEIIDEASNIDELNAKEIHWIAYYDCCVDGNKGYNLDKGGKNGLKSEETKRKISEAQKGEKNWSYGLRGSDCHNAKKVKNLTTGKVFDSLVDCAIHDFGDRKYMKQISAVCSPSTNRISVKGYKYALLDDQGEPIMLDKPSPNKAFNKVIVVEAYSGMEFASIAEASRHFRLADSFIRDRIYGRVKRDRYADIYNFKIKQE